MSTLRTDNVQTLDGTVTIPVKDLLTTGNNTAAKVAVAPTGNLTSTTVQGALVELQGDADTLASGKLNKAGGVLTGALGYAPQVAVPSAQPDLSGVASNNILITGGSNITTLGNVSAGQVRILKFEGASPNLFLKHSAISTPNFFRLPGNADIQVAADDVAVMRSLGGGSWECLLYQRAAVAPGGSASLPVQTEFIFYKSTNTPLIGTADGSAYNWPGTALTANTFKLHVNYLIGKKVKMARWVLVWNPQTSNPASPTSVRVVSFDDGPSNLAQIARVDSPTSGPATSPRVDVVDITNAWQGILDAGNIKQFGHQTFGNGTGGCMIYGSWLEVVW